VLAAKVLVTAGVAVVLLLGCAHLAYTFVTDRLNPRDAEVMARLKVVPLKVSRETTMWRTWIGFNASHSTGLIFFALCYGYLALWHADLLFHSPFLAVLGALMLVGYLVLAKLYWFSAPLMSIALATVLYLLGYVVALS